MHIRSTAVALLLAPLLWRQRSCWTGGAGALGLIFLLGAVPT